MLNAQAIHSVTLRVYNFVIYFWAGVKNQYKQSARSIVQDLLFVEIKLCEYSQGLFLQN